MSDQFNNDKLRHEVALETAFDGNNAAAERGMIGTGVHEAKLAELEIDPKTGRKKDNLSNLLLAMAMGEADLVPQLDKIEADLQEARNDLNDLQVKNKQLGKINQAASTMDIDLMRLMLINEWDLPADMVNEMDSKQVFFAFKDHAQDVIKGTETLIEERLLSKAQKIQDDLDSVGEGIADIDHYLNNINRDNNVLEEIPEDKLQESMTKRDELIERKEKLDGEFSAFKEELAIELEVSKDLINDCVQSLNNALTHKLGVLIKDMTEQKNEIRQNEQQVPDTSLSELSGMDFAP